MYGWSQCAVQLTPLNGSGAVGGETKNVKPKGETNENVLIKGRNEEYLSETVVVG